jgi:hypothetical protein
MRLNPDLKLADLADSEFFFNSRIFLAALAEDGAVPATATGNLTRAFVGKMFEKLRLAKHFKSSISQFSKVVNEQDLWPLHIVRIVCECAGLVARRQKQFRLTKMGRALLDDEQAGKLFRELFLAYFRRFDLHYDFHLRAVPGIQETMAVILWRLDTVARDWKCVQGLAPEILLPGVLVQLRQAMAYPHDTEEWILCGYVLDPLLDFGLIESKQAGEWRLTEKDSIRVTSLWRKFIQFASDDNNEKVQWN